MADPRGLLHRLFKVIAYTVASLVVLLAIAVGLFRLLLPRLPEYQEEIKAWASSAIGMQVEFLGMDARWGLTGPELSFHGAELIQLKSGAVVIAADEVGVGVSLSRLLLDRTLVVDKVTIRSSSLQLEELDDGRWLVQGQALGEWIQRRDGRLGSITLVGEALRVSLQRTGTNTVRVFTVPSLSIEHDANRTAVDFGVLLPPELGGTITVFATQITSETGVPEPWNVNIESPNLNLAGLSALYGDDKRRVTAGTGSIDMSLALTGGRPQSVSAQFDLVGVSLNQGPTFDAAGRLAISDGKTGWLAAVDELKLQTANGAWPQTSLRVDASTGDDDTIDALEARASYLNFSDAGLIEPWMSADQLEFAAHWRADGVVRNLVLNLPALSAESPRYAITAELDRVGIAAAADLPGIRGFSGSLRADQDSGLLAIATRNATLDLSAWIPEAVELDNIDGTLIWRRSGDRMTVLSDSITIRNAILDSQSSIEIVLEQETPPRVDLSTSFSISDVAVAKRFIPQRIMPEKLHQWFQDALVKGTVSKGEARLSGELDRFPFNSGGGSFSLKATANDAVLQYLPSFPPSLIREAEVVLENTHLFSRQNRSTNQGNLTVNARVDIRNLLEPVLEIKGRSTGTLKTIAEFADNSPIAEVFGGHLGRVTLDGNASLDLDLLVPIRQWRKFEFSALIASKDGRLAVAGLNPPLTGLSGNVTVSKDSIASEDLTGVFLGEPVAIELENAPADQPAYRIVANATGAASAAAIVTAFELPLADRLSGTLAYEAQLLFPRGGQEPPVGLSIELQSDLSGLSSDLPAPLGKAADARWPVQASVTFEPGGELIRTTGSLEPKFDWQISFARADERWDFDRGVVAFGQGAMEEPDVRGLHIGGRTDEVQLADWLVLSRGQSAGRGAGERIRSVDIVVDNFYYLGQHLEEQRVRVDRSARDWLVQLDGNDMTGSIFVPYDFSASSTLVLDMERFVLPGDARAESAEPREPERIDPRNLPAISFRSKEFGVGERRFGALEAEFEQTAEGLVSTRLNAVDASFSIHGSARWINDIIDPLDSRTYLDVSLTSIDVEQTMQRLGYQPGIVSDDMRIALDLNWSGGPRAEFLSSVDGAVDVRLGTGQLDEVEPGAGRVFGLMSIVALPRRLSLDFRDVFQKGFGFDEIGGTFKLENGLAYTCDLSLEGPAADIAIIGQADLVAGEYEQTAVVSAKVGNTLPVVGALAAGPQVAAAMFLLTQIFKKPLQDLGQVYYSMHGSWDSPVVESTDAEAFTTSGRVAGCLSDSE